jgi:hypothetical protein
MKILRFIKEHRPFFIFSFFYTILIVYSCEKPLPEKRQKVKECYNEQLQALDVYVFDSCEYVGKLTGYPHDVLTHKGNCKFCIKRSKN